MFKNFKKLPTSKKFLYFLFGNCALIELYVLIITTIIVLQTKDTLITPDFTPLNTLVGAFITQAVGYAVYSIKSLKENTVGGITYMMAEKDDEEAEG